MPQTDTHSTKRPYIPADSAKRVEQYASKQGLSDREAYKEIIEMTLNEEGGLKR